MSSKPEQSRSASRKVDVKAAEPLLSFVPISVLTDSYKTTHYMQYPESRKMVAVREPQTKPAGSSCVETCFDCQKHLCCSMQSFGMALIKMSKIHDLYSMEYDTYWRPSLPGSGLREILIKQLVSSGQPTTDFVGTQLALLSILQ